jgi:hypothetical protein
LNRKEGEESGLGTATLMKGNVQVSKAPFRLYDIVVLDARRSMPFFFFFPTCP